MRRGRMGTLIAALAALSLMGAAGAQAASPQDICKDLQDGKVDGTYTSAEWTAFLTDPTVQGYCSPIVVVTPPPTTTTVVTQTPPAPPSTPAGPGTPAVPLTPTSGVAGVQATQTAQKPAAPTRQASVKGTQHTVSAPVTASAAGPLATTRSSGTLPFTGAQLALFALVGLALLATGFVLRSTARSSDRT